MQNFVYSACGSSGPQDQVSWQFTGRSSQLSGGRAPGSWPAAPSGAIRDGARGLEADGKCWRGGPGNPNSPGKWRIPRDVCHQIRGSNSCAALLPEEDTENRVRRSCPRKAALQGTGPGDERMREETFDNVLDAIEDDPAVAANLKLRSLLMIELERHIKREKWTQAKAARLLGVTQPRISDLMRGKINSFGLDMLVKMATSAGLRVS